MHHDNYNTEMDTFIQNSIILLLKKKFGEQGIL